MKNNDQKILDLKRKIEDKKQEIGKLERFIPYTNCKLDLDGQSYNLHVLGVNDLQFVLVKLNMYVGSAIELGIKGFEIGGYRVSDWMGDIQARLQIIEQESEQKKLKQLESQLEKLLSDEKKTELEIDKIAELLG